MVLNYGQKGIFTEAYDLDLDLSITFATLNELRLNWCLSPFFTVVQVFFKQQKKSLAFLRLTLQCS